MNPWKTVFNEFRSINNLRSSIQDIDFIALKIGDINQSATAFLGSRDLVPRSTGQPLSWLVLPAMDLLPGMEVEIPVSLNTSVEGCQFALFIDPAKLEVLELVYGKADAQHVNTNELAEGRLLLSWDEPSSASAPSDDFLIKVRARAKTPGPLSKAFYLDPRSMTPESYRRSQGGELDAVSLGIAFEAPSLMRPILYPVVPNPAIGQALLRWELPQQSEVRLVVRDAWNRRFVEVHQVFGPGEHTIELQRSQLPASGMYFVTLEAGAYIFSEKLIFLE